MIEENVEKPDKRIQQLFLTGDQIYADDVPTCLLPVFYDLGCDVLGGADTPAEGQEELPHEGGGVARVTMDTAPPMRRTVLVRREGGFTSVAADNHIITFGEYSAMYLMAWSPRVWRAPATEDRCYSTAESAGAFVVTKLRPLILEKGEPPERFEELLRERKELSFKHERQRVLVFASTVAKVARVLANTSTYMIFDDHDVTDDWNINATWRNRVFSRECGKTIVRNAMLAYTYFQAWGSDPWSFNVAGQPNTSLLPAAEAYLATARNRPADRAEELDRLFGIKPGAEKRAKFHYQAEGTLYRVRVLDSRTRRTFPYSTGCAPAFLIGEGEESTLDAQLPKGPLQVGDKFLLVVASTPVLGPEILERIIVPGVAAGADIYRAFRGYPSDFEDQPDTPGSSLTKDSVARTPGALFIDVETWPSNELGQHELLGRLATYGKAIVLGGDVHYGMTLAMDWYSYDRTIGDASRKKSRIVQVTSSASRNALMPEVEVVARGYHWMNQWILGVSYDGFAWKDGHRLEVPDEGNLSLVRYSRMKEKPSLLPAWGWPEGTRFEAGGDPDWSWRLEAQRDMRNNFQRKGAFEEHAETLKEDIAAVAAKPRGIERAREALALHQKAGSLKFAPLRDWVMTNNVGILTFEPNEDDTVVLVHTLWSTTENDYPEEEIDDELVARRPLGEGARVSGGAPNTVVRIPLEPAGEPPQPHSARR
jgi:hypothetical protein